MEISRRAAIMNGKFESTSKNQDESNLNRPRCWLMKEKAHLMPISSGVAEAQACTCPPLDSMKMFHVVPATYDPLRPSRLANNASLCTFANP